jgi:DegV family protein with EDD domain
MSKIKFIVDSNCDIPANMAESLDIEIIPFAIRVAGSEYFESRTITAQEFYQVQRSAKDIPITFHIAPGIFYAKFCHAFENGYSCVICTTMTSQGSGTYHNAQMGRDWFFERYPDAVGRFEIYILDSKNYSIAYGYGVIRGAAACRAGASVQIVLAAINSWFDSLETYFTVFSQKHARNSGRIGSVMRQFGRLPFVYPLISCICGTTKMEKRVWGGRNAAVCALAEKFAEHRLEGTDYVILRGENGREADRLAQLAQTIAGKPPVGVFFAGPSTVANTGTKITGIGFMGKDV